MDSMNSGVWVPAVAITLVFSLMRVTGNKGNAFKAFAHCFVGYLAGVVVTLTYIDRFDSKSPVDIASLHASLFWFITGVEVFMFLIQRVWPKISNPPTPPGI